MITEKCIDNFVEILSSKIVSDYSGSDSDYILNRDFLFFLYFSSEIDLISSTSFVFFSFLFRRKIDQEAAKTYKKIGQCNQMCGCW